MTPKTPKKTKARVYVLDSYAMLAYLEGEPEGERVKAILRAAERGECRVLMSLINLGEVLYITERERNLARAQEVLALIEQFPLQIIEVSREMVLAAAHIKAQAPIAYADAFAVVAAQANDGVVLTGDPEFEAVRGMVEVQSLEEED